MDFDALLLSRIQFAFTIAFHILFPAFTIGLASYLAVLEGLWLFTRREVFKTLFLYWVKIFAISFGMGVVSGVVMSYQFGTNWSEFSRLAMPVIGPLLGYEVLTAFFLEASFLGIMLFGWRKVGPGLHFLATCLVAIGTAVSGFWILSANSWMQTPAGFAVGADGRMIATDYLQVIFNPSFPARFAHMMTAAYLTTALAVAGASAFQRLRGTAGDASRTALRMAVLLIAVAAPLQLAFGHWSGEVVKHHQPAKLAAIEAWWETRADQPFVIFAVPDRELQANRHEVAIPKVGSMVQLAEPGEVIPGLDRYARADQPPVAPVFFSFRIMVGLGLLMIGLGFWGAFVWWRGRIDRSRWFQRAAVLMSPAGFAAVLTGWFVAEIGRQPWVVYGVLRTADAVSPVPAGHVAFSLLAYMVVYAVVFTAGALFILRLVREGPQGAEPPPTEQRPPGWTLAAAPRDVPGDPE